jgi:transposase
MTVKLWGLNPRTWLSAYLHARAANGNQPPTDLNPFLPWAMDAERLAMMKRAFLAPDHSSPEEIDTS